MKLAHGLPAFARGSALALLILGGAAARAAAPAERVPPSLHSKPLAWDVAGRDRGDRTRFNRMAAGDGTALSFDLATATAWHSDIWPSSGFGLAVAPGVEPLERVRNWNRYGGSLLGSARKRSNVAINAVRTGDRHPIRYLVTVNRRRVQLRLITVF